MVAGRKSWEKELPTKKEQVTRDEIEAFQEREKKEEEWTAMYPLS